MARNGGSDDQDDEEMLYAAPPGEDGDDDDAGDGDDDGEDDDDADEEEESEEESNDDDDDEQGEDEATEDDAEEEEDASADADADADADANADADGDADADADEEEDGEEEDDEDEDEDADVFASRDDFPNASDEDFEDDSGDWDENDYLEHASALFGEHEFFGDTAHDRYVDGGYELSGNHDRFAAHLANYDQAAARTLRFYERDGRVVPQGFVRSDLLELLLQLFPNIDTSELNLTIPRPQTNNTPAELPPELAAIDPHDSVDLRKFCSPIGDQGQTNRCGAFAYTHAVELSNRILGRDVQLACSYTMLLTQRRQGDARDFKWAYKGGDGTAGTFEPGEELIARGTCRHDLWPNDQPHPSAAEHDLARDATEYRLRARVMDIGIDDVKKVLSAGNPVWFFMNTGEKFQDIGRDGVYHASEKPHGQHGCHAMLLVGYVGNYFIVKNSWGDDFGDKGYIYIPKKVLADAEPGFVAILLETPAISGGASAGTAPQPMQRSGARGEAAAFASAVPRTVTCPYCKAVTQMSPRCPSCGAPR